MKYKNLFITVISIIFTKYMRHYSSLVNFNQLDLTPFSTQKSYIRQYSVSTSLDNNFVMVTEKGYVEYIINLNKLSHCYHIEIEM